MGVGFFIALKNIYLFFSFNPLKYQILVVYLLYERKELLKLKNLKKMKNLIDTSKYEETANYELPLNPTTRGIMLRSYADLSGATCAETKEEIKAGDRFVMYGNLLYSELSKTYQEQVNTAFLHDWGC